MLLLLTFENIENYEELNYMSPSRITMLIIWVYFSLFRHFVLHS